MSFGKKEISVDLIKNKFTLIFYLDLLLISIISFIKCIDIGAMSRKSTN